MDEYSTFPNHYQMPPVLCRDCEQEIDDGESFCDECHEKRPTGGFYDREPEINYDR